MIARKGKPRELSPLEKYADSIVAGMSDSLEPNGVKKEFKKLSKNEQSALLLYARLRQRVKEFCSDPEKIYNAFKKARDRIFNNQNN